MQVYENFISYRRKESSLEVKNIYDALQKRGFSTFCDIYSLGSGKFNEDLITAIDNCTNFLLVLGSHSLDRCTDSSDWVYNEIKEALLKKKNIICIFINDFQFPDVLPTEISNIRYQNGIKFDVFYFDNFIDKLITKFLVSEDVQSISDEAKDFIIINNVLIKYVGSAHIVNIPDNIEVIGKNAFKNQTKITKIILSNKIREIQESAFERCIGITFLSFPKTLKKIGKKAFCRCYNLAYLEINDELEEIGDECFCFCEKLKTLTLGSKADKISSSAFNNCSSLMEIHVLEANQKFMSIQGILYDKDVELVIRCPENYSLDVITLPITIKHVGKWCFSKCVKLIDIILPRSLETIDAHAFQDSGNIASLTLGDSICELDISAFNGWNEQQRIMMGKKFNPVIKYNIEQKFDEIRTVKHDKLSNNFCLIKTAFESEEEAIKIAKLLLDKHLIVSAQLRKMRSLYMWENDLDNEEEIELTCFTETGLYTEIEKFINEHHSYELCELICLQINYISDAFGEWISEYVGKIKFDL